MQNLLKMKQNSKFPLLIINLLSIKQLINYFIINLSNNCDKNKKLKAQM